MHRVGSPLYAGVAPPTLQGGEANLRGGEAKHLKKIRGYASQVLSTNYPTCEKDGVTWRHASGEYCDPYYTELMKKIDSLTHELDAISK